MYFNFFFGWVWFYGYYFYIIIVFNYDLGFIYMVFYCKKKFIIRNDWFFLLIKNKNVIIKKKMNKLKCISVDNIISSRKN